jgi:hypothetical protein
MVEKKIDILIRAKSAVAAGLKRVGDALKKFGLGVWRIGAFFTKAFLRAGVAVAGFAAVTLRAFSVQEKAVTQVEAAFRAYGEEVDQNTEKVKRFAAAIQDETGIADESTIALAANLKLLGVHTDSLEDAVKATIALQKAGMKGAAASRAVAAATQGDFEALQRYLPALKTTKDEAEKAAIVNEFVTKSYAAQKDELDTVAGLWEAFKGRVGDATEALGGVIANSGAAKDMMKRAGDAVKQFGENVQKWIEDGGLANAIATLKLFGENARTIFTQATTMAVGFFKGGVMNPAKAAFEFAGSVVGNFFNVWRTSAALQRDFTVAAWKHIGETIAVWANNTVARLRLVKDFAVAVAKKAAKPWQEFKPPDMDAFRKSLQEVSKFQAPDTSEFKSAIADLAKAVKGEFVEKVPNAFEQMFDKLTEEEKRHADKVAEIGDAQLDALKGSIDERVNAEAEAQEKIVVAAVNAAKKKAALKKKEEALAKQVAQKEVDAKKAAINKEIRALQEAQNKRKEIAEKTVAGVLAEARAKEEARKQEAKDTRKALQLREKEARGIKLGREQREFLAAFERIQAARAGVAGGAVAIKGAQERLKLLDKQSKALVDIKKELADTRKDLNKLLKRN